MTNTRKILIVDDDGELSEDSTIQLRVSGLLGCSAAVATFVLNLGDWLGLWLGNVWREKW